MIKFKKGLSLIIIMTFFLQNAAFCLPDVNSLLRVPLKFGKTGRPNEVKSLKLILDKTAMIRRFEELEKMVNAKLEEFDIVATSPEEKLDRERALRRIEKLSEIGKFLSNLDAELFKQYMDYVAKPLLELDVRYVNFILASKAGESFVRILLRPLAKDSIKPLIESMIEKKTNWNKKFYYLPGLPIVVEAGRLSDKNMEKLNKAALLIVDSGWLNVRQGCLSYVEAVIPVETVKRGGGVPGFLGRNYIYINERATVESIAEAIIHEGTHSYIDSTMASFIDQLYYSFPDTIIKHPFFYSQEGGTANILFGELWAYGVELQFKIYILRDHKPENDIIKNRKIAILGRRGVSMLKEMGCRGDEINELTEFWEDLSIHALSDLKRSTSNLTFTATRESREDI